MNMQQDRERIIAILQKYGMLCKSEDEVCNVSASGKNCSCGKVYDEIRNA